MPRKGYIAKRDVLQDPIYNSKLVTRLINKIMLDGKRGVAQSILYNAFDIVEAKTGREPMEVFEQALENIMPLLELKVRRVGGANYQVPVEVSSERRLTLGLRWLVNYMKKQWNRDWLLKLSMLPTELVHLLRRRMTHTKWLKLIRLSLITAGNLGGSRICHVNIH